MKKKQQNEQGMTKTLNASVDKRRRKALVAGATGVAAGAAWHKPVIDSVVLPAHAQTSMGGGDDPSTFSDGDTFVLNPQVASHDSNSPFDPLSLFISDAHAGDGSPGRNSLMKLTYVAASNSFNYEQVNRNRNIKRVANGLTEGGASVDTTVDNECGGGDNQPSIPIHSVTIVDIVASGIVLELTSRVDDGDGGASDRGDNTFFLEPGDYPVETNCGIMNGNVIDDE